MTTVSNQADNFTATVLVDQSPQTVFSAIANVRGWWSENIEGPTDRPGEQFTYRHQNVHRCTILVTEMTSPTRVAWQVVDNFFDFTEDTKEWSGTEIRFDIVPRGSKTEIQFTHAGSRAGLRVLRRLFQRVGLLPADEPPRADPVR